MLNYRPFFHVFNIGTDNKISSGPSYISWADIKSTYDRDKNLDANYVKLRVLNPGNNKQNVDLANAIFHETTVVGCKKYLPEVWCFKFPGINTFAGGLLQIQINAFHPTNWVTVTSMVMGNLSFATVLQIGLSHGPKFLIIFFQNRHLRPWLQLWDRNHFW